MSLAFIWALASAAAPTPLERARTLYAEVQYGEAIALLDSVLSQGNLGSAEREQASLLIGFCQTGLGNVGAARKRFAEVLEANADAKLPPGTSPKIREAFEKVRTEIKARVTAKPAEPFLRPAAEAEGYTARFIISGAGMPSLLSKREGMSGWLSTPLTRESDGQWSTTFPSGKSDISLQYYVEVRDPTGRVQSPLGSDITPEHVVLPPRVKSVTPIASASHTGVLTSPPLYPRWWLWTVVGAVVVGAAAGITAGVIVSERAVARPGSLNVTLEVAR